MSEDLDLETRVAALERRIESLEKGRSGRRAKPILVSQPGICGVEPAIDSSTCPYASIYRRQKGCQGDACIVKATRYYTLYRASRNAAE